MDGFARVLFQMDAFDADQPRNAGASSTSTSPSPTTGVVKLAYLIALRQIGVEVILAVKGRAQVDRSLQPKAGPHGLFHAKLVDDRQHPRHRGVHEGHVRVRLGPDLG